MRSVCHACEFAGSLALGRGGTHAQPLHRHMRPTAVCFCWYPALIRGARPALHACGQTGMPPRPRPSMQIELMTMRHKLASDTRLIRGLVLDHGAVLGGQPRAPAQNNGRSKRALPPEQARALTGRPP